MKNTIKKRIRITKNGKMVRRVMGVNHFHTRKSGKRLRTKRKSLGLDFPLKTIISSNA